jgi:cytochrome c-type biogenesis protein CcmH/NrfG
MRSFILFLKKLGVNKVVSFFIIITLIVLGVLYFVNKSSSVSDDSRQTTFDNGDYTKSIAQLEKWIETNPNDINALEFLAASYIQKADNEPLNAKLELSKAIKVLNSAVRLNPERSEIYRLLGIARLYQNNLPAAEVSFTRSFSLSNGENLNAKAGLGMVAEKKGDWRTAQAIYQKVLDTDSQNETANLGMARFYISDKKADLAKKQISILATTTKNNAVLGEIYSIFGSVESLKNNTPKSVENYEKSLTYRPNNVHTIVLYGESLINQYRYTQSVERKELLNKIIDTANRAILVDSKYLHAQTFLYKTYVLQNKYNDANGVAQNILKLLETDTALSETQKKEYTTYYSQSITSVKINSVKTEEIKK